MKKGMYEKAKEVLFSPVRFFKGLDEKSIKPAFFYSIVLGIITSILALSYGFLTNLAFYAQSWWILVLVWVAEILILNFILAGILCGWILLFGGKGSYLQTYQMMVYSSTPVNLLGWIPYVNYAAYVYSFVLMIIGTSEIYKMSKTRSTLMYILLIFILVLISAVIVSLYILGGNSLPPSA